MYENINKCIISSTFLDEIKLAEVIPIFKKDDRTCKNNYRPISILPNLSKIYEKCLYDQLSNFFEQILSNYQFGFRKGISAQQCLMVFIEKWKNVVDQKGVFCALLTDLSKAFDSLNHDLLIAKLHNYGFQTASLKLIHSYLTNRKQNVRIGNVNSSTLSVNTGVPQGSILGPLLFNIHMCDLFYILPDLDIVNYADDTTQYVSGVDFATVLESIERCAFTMFDWFKVNYMKANSDKSHLLLSTNGKFSANINGDIIENDENVELLGITIDSNFSFHMNSLCTKACQKLSALTRISNYMNIDQRRRVMKAFISSHFGYCPLVWMFCSRSFDNRINRIHEKALRIVYNDRQSSFDELLEKDNSVSIHTRNLQLLIIEIYKIKHNLSPPLVINLFQIVSS